MKLTNGIRQNFLCSRYISCHKWPVRKEDMINRRTFFLPFVNIFVYIIIIKYSKVGQEKEHYNLNYKKFQNKHFNTI